MRRLRMSMIAVALCLAAVLAIGLGLRLYMGREAENRLAPSERISIAELRSPLPANGSLACPAGYCQASATESPFFAMPWSRLAGLFAEIVAAEPGIARIASEAEGRRLVLIQHTAVLRFPDIITVEFVPVASERSSLAIYSRARYGKYDFGANRKRVKRWLALLQQAAGAR